MEWLRRIPLESVNCAAAMTPLEPDLLYSVLCDEVRREDNGKWIFLGAFDALGAGELPLVHPHCCVVNKWLGGAGAWMQQTRFVDEDDRVLIQSELLPFELNGLNASFTAVQMFGHLRLENEGLVWVEVYLNNELKQRYPLRVELLRRVP